MPVPAIVDSLEAVPEALRPDYKPIEGGKFRLDVTGAEEAYAAGLKKSQQTILEEKKQREQELAAYKNLGLTAEQIAALKQQSEEAEQKKAKEEGRFNELLEQANAKHKNELAAREADKQFVETELSKHLIDSKALEAATEADAFPKILLPIIKPYIKMVVDGEGANRSYQVRIIDEAGQPRMVYENGASRFMTIKDLVLEKKADVDNYGGAFRATGAGGTGSPAANRQQQVRAGLDPSKLSPADKIALGLQQRAQGRR